MTVIFAHDLVVADDQGPLLGPLTFHLDEGQCLGVLGAPRSGKTILYQLLTGNLPAGVRIDGGRLFYRNRDLAGGAAEPVSTYPVSVNPGADSAVATAGSDDQMALIADTAAIGDPAERARTLRTLLDRRAETGAAIIITAVDPADLPPECDALAILMAGHLAEHGPGDILSGVARHPYTAQGDVSMPLDRPPAGCPFRGSCELAVDLCESAPMTLQIVDIDHATACIRWREMVPAG